MSELSPGPWTPYHESDGDIGIENDGGVPLVQAVYASDADLQVMAAAPELLEACEAFVSFWREVEPEDVDICIFSELEEARGIADNAIHKARGDDHAP